MKQITKNLKSDLMNPENEVDVVEIRARLGRYYGLARPLTAAEVETALAALKNNRSWRPQSFS